MRKTTIGPIPLHSGLQLSPAEGRPDGLLRALNMEMRDGFCATRRGSSYRAAIDSESTTTAASISPAAWNGQSVSYVGHSDASIAALDDAIGILQLEAAPGSEETADGVTIEFWGDDNAWHQLEHINVVQESTGLWMRDMGGFVSAYIYFVIPRGWKSGIPTGTGLAAAYWLRLTRASGTWVTTDPITGAFRQQLISSDEVPSWMFSADTRSSQGPFVAVKDVTGATARFNLFNLASPMTAALDYLPGYLMRSGNAYPFTVGEEPDTDDGDPVGCYIPALDSVFMYMGGHYYNIRDLDDMTTGRSRFVPQTAEQYADIATRNALPGRPECICVFGGRVFLLGFPDSPQKIVWSAPGEFCETWPATNEAFLSGAGRILWAAVVNQTMFIFTTSGIWRAALGDPTPGEESLVFLDAVEDTPCAAKKSVQVVGENVVFLAPDGIRSFNGSASRLLSQGVRDLFRPDSGHEKACLRKADAIGAWHPVERQYWLSYPEAGSRHHDCLLVVDLDDESAWLWGANASTADVQQRERGMRASAMCWSSQDQKMVCMDPERVIFNASEGPSDLGSQTRWHLETQNLRLGSDRRSVLARVVIQVLREHFDAFSVIAIPDGNRGRQDTRSLAVEPDRLDTSAVVGGTLDITALNIEASIAPVIARYRSVGRNHRIRIESTGDHMPIAVFSISADIYSEEGGR